MAKKNDAAIETTTGLVGGVPSLLRVTDDQTLNEMEAARFLGLRASKTLYFWRVQGRGPRFMRYGTRCIRYRVKDLVAWQEQRLVGGCETRDVKEAPG
jgi:predicted DNA-binding transcriptional regulator AlpA